MKRLWAGWRMAYVEKAGLKPGTGCLFCRLAALKPSETNLIIEKRDDCLIVLNAFPYNCGHLMVAPIKHRPWTASLTTGERAAVWDGMARSETALRKAYRPHGINVGLNLGRPAGAGVVGHVHFHLVPRWNGDTNFMPVVAGTKVLPESLDVTWKRLREVLGSIA
ncbi:MAG: histidine triad (HIT) protein [bacterium]|nr:MAG: histidine triad (HIT) protein [bacterium]